MSSKPRTDYAAEIYPSLGTKCVRVCVCASMARENIKYVKWIWFGVVGNRSVETAMEISGEGWD